jgi:hypothetical protein
MTRQPLRQPRIEVNPQGRMGEDGEVCFVERHGVLLEAVKSIQRKPGSR